MAAKGARGLHEAMRGLSIASYARREAASIPLPSAAFAFTRSMATEASSSPTITTNLSSNPQPPSYVHWRPATTVPVTIFDFPSFEPQRLESWSTKHLYLPLRRDILHLAVIYEGDNTRQGTASSKTRYDVAGSHRKLYAQKGLGRARVGSKQSPIRRGGGKTFGPQPRDFGTNINRKVYDLAWRTALSYRYRRGELVVCRDGMDLPLPAEFEAMLRGGALRGARRELEASFRAKWAKQVLDNNGWGRRAGRSTIITTTPRESLSKCLEPVPAWGRTLTVEDVDVKDLLETGRLVIERDALLEMIERHQSDITPPSYVLGALPNRYTSGEVLVE